MNKKSVLKNNKKFFLTFQKFFGIIKIQMIKKFI